MAWSSKRSFEGSVSTFLSFMSRKFGVISGVKEPLSVGENIDGLVTFGTDHILN